MPTDLPFGPGALFVMVLYILSLLGVGGYAYYRSKENSLSDFFLGGREFGVGVLLLTLYATQYSGNTLFGFSGAAYRDGLRFLVCTQFMTAIVVGYLILAPRLFRLSREQKFITPGDFIYYRFQSKGLRLVITVIMVYVLCNFTLSQMKALGTVFSGLSHGRIPLWVGVVGLALIMLIYESLGGMRSVAWTDVLQGGILMIGFILLIIVAFGELGDLPGAIEKLASDPNTKHKVLAPEGDGLRTWLSFILMVGLGATLYPQAIQRIYASKNSVVLKKSLAIMGFLPLTTTLVAVTVGILMAAEEPNLGNTLASGKSTVIPSETVLALMCLKVMQSSELGYWLVVIIFSAILAAVMSTADSAMLSISSMITKDIYGECFRPDADQKHLTKIGKLITWILMAPIVFTAIHYEGTLIQLLKIKFDILLQCVPAFYLGVHFPKLSSKTVTLGLIVGLVFTLLLSFSGDLGLAEKNYNKVWGFHSGVLSLGVNLLICFFGIFYSPKNIQPSAK